MDLQSNQIGEGARVKKVAKCFKLGQRERGNILTSGILNINKAEVSVEHEDYLHVLGSERARNLLVGILRLRLRGFEGRIRVGNVWIVVLLATQKGTGFSFWMMMVWCQIWESRV